MGRMQRVIVFLFLLSTAVAGLAADAVQIRLDSAYLRAQNSSRTTRPIPLSPL